MARPLSSSDFHRNGKNGSRSSHGDIPKPSGLGGSVHANVDRFNDDSPGFRPEARELDLLQPEFGSVNPQEVEILRDENHQLRALVAELERHLEELTGHGNEAGAANQVQELEGVVEEKTQVIRELHVKIQSLQHELKEKALHPVELPHEEELLKLQEELERERCQLQEDEQTMMQQMRDMEVQMARERAEIARQRNDLQRLHGEIRHELEMAARDSALRERMAPLQRRHQDVINRRGTPATSTSASSTPAAEQPPPPQPPAEAKPVKDSGLLRRLFR